LRSPLILKRNNGEPRCNHIFRNKLTTVTDLYEHNSMTERQEIQFAPITITHDQPRDLVVRVSDY
jgi:hypothetical protein